jgi:cyclopropane fatty-acyl-phospholipid synthase-like methyltransferase
MKKIFSSIFKEIMPLSHLLPEGDKGIKKIGHRNYVGGMWEEIGTLQFEFLLSKGLKPDSYLLDIACGSLRLGVKAVPYLERSHYLGIEKEISLVKMGIEKELDPLVRTEKTPNIVISETFEFEKFKEKADFAIAQSLFTHLPSEVINLCFKKLYLCLKDDGVFYATFFQTDRRYNNHKRPHDHGYFAYTKTEMCEFGEENGFTYKYIGDWNHPRNQKIVEYRIS